MPVKMTPLARDHPAMTADPCAPFMAPITKDLNGLTDIPVFVDSRQNWISTPPCRSTSSALPCPRGGA